MWHYPEDSDLQGTLEKVLGGLAPTGFDPFVGRKLFHFCYEAGLAELNVRVDPYHLYAGEINGRDLDLWRLKLEIAKPRLLEILGSEAAATEYIRRFLRFLQRPDTLTYSCMFTVTGTKP